MIEIKFSCQIRQWARRNQHASGDSDHTADEINDFVSIKSIALLEDNLCEERWNKRHKWNCGDVFSAAAPFVESSEVVVTRVFVWVSWKYLFWYENQSWVHEALHKNIQQSELDPELASNVRASWFDFDKALAFWNRRLVWSVESEAESSLSVQCMLWDLLRWFQFGSIKTRIISKKLLIASDTTVCCTNWC